MKELCVAPLGDAKWCGDGELMARCCRYVCTSNTFLIRGNVGQDLADHAPHGRGALEVKGKLMKHSLIANFGPLIRKSKLHWG
jgi:hypothetical protein